MRTAFIIDVHPTPSTGTEDINPSQAYTVFVVFLVAIFCWAMFAMFSQSAKKAKLRNTDRIIWKQRRLTGEAGPFAHLRLNVRHHHRRCH